jgi:hypothetical protein
MDLELLVKLAARLRGLSEESFLALKQIVENGAEDEAHLPNVAQALSDCIDITNDHNRKNEPLKFGSQPPMRLVL